MSCQVMPKIEARAAYMPLVAWDETILLFAEPALAWYVRVREKKEVVKKEQAGGWPR